MFSLGLEEFRNALSSTDVYMLSLVNKACREGVREWTEGCPTRLLLRDFVASKERCCSGLEQTDARGMNARVIHVLLRRYRR